MALPIGTFMLMADMSTLQVFLYSMVGLGVAVLILSIIFGLPKLLKWK